MSDKTYTAEELRSNKTRAMALAYSGETVKITNVRFPGGHFELRFVKPEQNVFTVFHSDNPEIKV